MKQTAVFLLFLVFVLFGCSENEEPTNPDLGYDYFPLSIGSYIIYEVDSIYHDQPEAAVPGVHDTTSYFIKEVQDSFILDAQDEESVRIERYKKDSLEGEWEIQDVWMAKRSSNNAERVEENRRFVKLGFPVSRTSSWDGNALNDLDEWTHTYDSIGSSRELNTLIFENTLRVNQRDFLTEVNDEFAFEIYAREVGLIHRYHKELFTRPNYLNNRVAENIISGNEYSWKVIEYGME
jgi:hypothetical protein